MRDDLWLHQRGLTHVYVAVSGNYCKVGATMNVRKRMRYLNHQSGFFNDGKIVLVQAWKSRWPIEVEARVRKVLGRPAKGLDWYTVSKTRAVKVVRVIVREVEAEYAHLARMVELRGGRNAK